MSKAFKKGELATYISVNSTNGAVYFRTVRVESCGNKRMTLSDTATGSMMGCDFFPGIGFDTITHQKSNWDYFAEKCPGRPRHHIVGHGTFKLMTVHAARAFCLKLSAEWLAYEIEAVKSKLASGNGEGYLTSMQIRLEQLKATEPTVIEK